MARFEITGWGGKPIGYVPVVNVAPGGRRIEQRRLPILIAFADGLPEGLAGLVATSDLQAYDSVDKPPFARRLAGLLVAEELELLAKTGDIPPLAEMGALLCGDFYAVPTLDRRGGLGNVLPVWEAFESRFSWTLGVAGNHDAYDGKTQVRGAIPDAWSAELLDGQTVERDGLMVGGVSGIIGPSGKAWRHEEAELERKLGRLDSPEILLLHEGPNVPGTQLPGSSEVRALLLGALNDSSTIICGHRHWPMVERRLGAHRVVSVDSRVVVITRRQ